MSMSGKTSKLVFKKAVLVRSKNGVYRLASAPARLAVANRGRLITTPVAVSAPGGYRVTFPRERVEAPTTAPGEALLKGIDEHKDLFTWDALAQMFAGVEKKQREE